MPNECPQCGRDYNFGSRYCGCCGCSLANEDTQEKDSLNSILLFATIVVAFILLVELICLFVKTPDILDLLSGVSFKLYFMLIDSHVAVLSGWSLQAYWIVIIISIAVSSVYALYRFVNALTKKEKTEPENTGMFWVSNSICFSLFFAFILVVILSILGQEMTSPFDDTSDTELMFLSANAALWEEILSRVLIIGVPMTLASIFITKKASAFKCLFGGFEFSLFAVVLVVLSSVLFGLAHSGWDQSWKIVQTGVLGLFLGYVFVRFGLYASILLHFITNYLTSFEWLGLGGDVALALISLALIGLGLVVFLYLIKNIANSKKTLDSLPFFFDRYSQDRSK
jgi:CAAX amino terminal protease family.